MAELANTERPMDDNPYVGPRTFIRQEAHKFFGRDREARHLIALIISEQLVLFYAQSGAGKSSLINTKIAPGLEKEGFEVLPIGAVRGHSGFDVEVDNIFTYNLISSLQQKDEAIPGQETMSLAEFLDCLVQEEGAFHYNCDYVYEEDEILKPRVLLIDQFEEILTTNTAFWEQREAFFKQLAGAMAVDDQLWVVLTMREDFVGGLDPYLYLLPDALQNHFYMRRLNREAALEAITQPVAGLRPFEEEAAQILVDNLRKIEVKEREREVHWGEFVEPVQLQAVCYQMWEKLKEHPGETITKADVAEFADVDTALINFYEDTIAAAVAETGVPEIDLRAWFENDLVTEAGTRNIVYRGDEYTGSLPTSVADYLNSRFIIREIARPGGVWFELIHDRFVEPIVQANQEWRLEQPLIQLCQEWLASGRSETHLLSSQQLDNYADTNWQALGPLVAEFVAASKEARDKREQRRAASEAERELEHQQALAVEERIRAEEAEQAAARQRRLTRIAMVIGIIAIIASIVAIYWFFDAQDQAEEAQRNAVQAEEGATRAAAEAEVAGTRSMEAVKAELEADSARVTAVRALETAQFAQSISDAARTVAEADATRAIAAELTAEAERENAEARAAELATARAQALDSLDQQAALLEELLQQSLTTTPTPEFVFVVEAADLPPLVPLSTPGGPTPTPIPTPTAVIPVTVNAQEDLARQLAVVRATQTAVAGYGRDEAATSQTTRETIFLGASVEGKPIEAVRFGNGRNEVLLVGGIHAGKSPSTVTIAEEMIAYFDENPGDIPENVTLFVVPNLNPDAADRTGQDQGRLNANGVDLNRNWNCGWVEDPQIGGSVVAGAGGREPLSEPETRALATFVRDYAPAAVVAWYAASIPPEIVPGGCPMSTVSVPLAEHYSTGSGYGLGDYDTGVVVDGDLSNWLDQLGVPAINVLLRSDEESDFDNNLSGLQEVMAFYSRQ